MEGKSSRKFFEIIKIIENVSQYLLHFCADFLQKLGYKHTHTTCNGNVVKVPQMRESSVNTYSASVKSPQVLCEITVISCSTSKK